MRIQNNITALNAHRQYGINNTGIAKSVEKLSSGYRINRAGDDAAGLAISEKMRAQIRGLNMASKNSQDAISLVQTAEGALQSTHDILQRMRELAVQASSDTNEQVIDRGALQKEFEQLQKEINDIAGKTRFNDQNLIDGTFQKYTKSISSAAAAFMTSIQSLSVARAVNPGTYTISVKGVAAVSGSVSAGSPAALTGSWASTFSTNGIGKLAGASWTFSGLDTAAHNGNTYSFKVIGEDITNMTIELVDSHGNTVSTARNVDATKITASASTSINFSGVGAFNIQLASGTSSLTQDDLDSFSKLGGDVTFDTGASAGKNPTVTNATKGYMEMTLGGETIRLYKGDTVANFKNSGIAFSFSAISDYDTSVAGATAKFAGATIAINVKQTEGKSMIIQTGANQGDELAINIDQMNTEMLGLRYSNISTQVDASKAITEVNDALNQVSTQRATLGALQNRLEYKISNLDISAENLQAAESRIRDVDMAKQMTEFTKQNILAQASTAMLAQANALPQGVLQLLG